MLTDTIAPAPRIVLLRSGPRERAAFEPKPERYEWQTGLYPCSHRPLLLFSRFFVEFRRLGSLKSENGRFLRRNMRDTAGSSVSYSGLALE